MAPRDGALSGEYDSYPYLVNRPECARHRPLEVRGVLAACYEGARGCFSLSFGWGWPGWEWSRKNWTTASFRIRLFAIPVAVA